MTVNKFFLSLLKVWFFYTHNHGKKLVFKTRFCDNEVNNCALSSSLRLVVRVDQLKFEGKA